MLHVRKTISSSSSILGNNLLSLNKKPYVPKIISEVNQKPTKTQWSPPFPSHLKPKFKACEEWFNKQKNYTPEWKQNLCKLLSRKSKIPEEHRTPLPTQPNSLKRKVCRNKLPSEELLLAMKNVAQNTPEWMEYRSGSYGASGHADIAGWAEFKTNLDCWNVDSGIECQKTPKNYFKDLFPCDHGHYREDEAGDVYSYIMGAKSKVTGMYLDKLAPWMHCSPDLDVEYPESGTNCHNKYTFCDPLHAIGEIKNPIRKAYMVTDPVTGEVRPTIPPYYMLQVINQMEIMGTEYCDFISHWRFNEQQGPIPCIPTNSSSEEGKEEKEGKEKAIRKFKIAETGILRVYKNEEAAAQIRKIITEHKAHVERAQQDIDNGIKPYPPPLNDHLDVFGKTTIVPLKRAVFYTTLEDEHSQDALDPETGDLLGNIDVDITDYWESKPISVTLHDLSEKVPKGTEINNVPSYIRACKEEGGGAVGA